jgi:catechol 2,3-dioxygenase-like lactoylglutathione lyase family enzyme
MPPMPPPTIPTDTCSITDEFRASARSRRCHRNQEDIVSTTQTRISKLGTVVIPVSDQDRAIEFYVEALGFGKRADVPFGNGYRWVEVGPADAATTIAIVPPPPGKPTGNVETGIGLHTDDIDAVHADLKARGVDVDEEISRMGDPVPPLFWFRDPDGNTLMVVEVS